MNTGDSSRRRFLLSSLSRLSSAWLALRWPAILEAQEHAQRAADSDHPPNFEFFSPAQAVEIEAIATQIIPGDDEPGAREAQVIYFIDHFLARFDRDKQPAYTQGLSDLRNSTQQLFSNASRFSSLAPAQQIQVLTAIEKTDFFEIVRLHTIMGYLSRPEYGGNHNQAGWKLIGFDDQMIYEPPFGYYDSQQKKRG